MPQAAEIDRFMRQLDHWRDDRKIGQALHEGVFDRFAEAFGQRHLLRRGHRLVAEEDNQVFQPGLPDFGDFRVGQVLREIDAADFRAERSGDRPDLNMPVGHSNIPLPGQHCIVIIRTRLAPEPRS